MSGRVVFLWLAVLASLISGGELAFEPGTDATQTSMIAEGLPGWERPASGSPSELPVSDVEESVLATATESEEESNGSGPDGLVPLAIVPFDLNHAASVRVCSIPPARSGRPVTRLRC